MRLFKPDQQLQIKCRHSVTGHELDLYYSIIETDIANRWMNLININNSRQNKLRYNYRKVLSEDEILDRFNKFRSNILYINANYDRQLTDIVDLHYLRENPHILNDLHEEYEIYGDRLENLVRIGYFSNPLGFPEYYHPVWPGPHTSNDKVLHEAFLLLNEQIHNFEAVYRNWGNNDKALCTCLFDFMPAGLHEDLKPEDYFLFSPAHLWGWAYLGYNTLGKHWASSCNDNDIDVVKRKQVRPQARFAAETYLNFSLKENEYVLQVNLYNWWLKNNFSDIINPADMKLSDLALGFIPIGKLSSYAANNGKLAQIDDSIDKQYWNKEVWSKCDTIVEVKVI